jgi:hypothetical protein
MRAQQWAHREPFRHDRADDGAAGRLFRTRRSLRHRKAMMDFLRHVERGTVRAEGGRDVYHYAELVRIRHSAITWASLDAYLCVLRLLPNGDRACQDGGRDFFSLRVLRRADADG